MLIPVFWANRFSAF